jgi:DNA-binding helix-hairpin-helix protein with protein kinase domain
MQLFDSQGRAIALTESGRSGGEGTVYPVASRPLWVAKIYHAAKLNAELHDKVRAMSHNPPVDPAWDARRHRSIAWVEDLLYHDAARTRFAGFTMPAIDRRQFREAHLYYDTSDRIGRFGGGFTWRHLLTAASNLASSVAAVHAQGHRVGDLRETNLLVSPSALISLIDCDSFQIRDTDGRVFATRVGTGEYLPPELHGADFRTDHDRTLSDRFALGVLIFKFLMLGVHPFQSKGRLVDDAPSTEAKVIKGAYPYERRRGIEPPDFAPPYDLLPPDVRALFHRCFVDGHRKPRRRPAPDEWFAALKSASKQLRTCAANENHWYAKHLRACPWCKLARNGAPDPFPAPNAPVGQQQVVAPATPRVVAVPGRAPVVAAATAVTPPRARRVPSLRWPRITRRRLIAVTSVTGLLVALLSPLGHTIEAPRREVVRWSATRSGPCPFDATRAASPPRLCTARWTLGPLTRTEHRSRSLFVVRTARTQLRVAFTLRFASQTSCEIPWVDAATFNEHAQRVCFAPCSDRIALRNGDRLFALVEASGVAADTGTLSCGRTYRGSWTFDATGVQGRTYLRYPGLDEITLPA